MSAIYTSDGNATAKATGHTAIKTSLLSAGSKLIIDIKFSEKTINFYLNDILKASFVMKNLKENLLYPAVGIILFN